MEQIADILFLINIAWMLTHELDAVAQHEWRVLPVTAWMDDTWGYRVFLLAHIPLFVLLMGNIHVRVFQMGFDSFLIIHAGLHILFRHHPDYTFDSGLSHLLIFGAIPLALIHLVLVWH